MGVVLCVVHDGGIKDHDLAFLPGSRLVADAEAAVLWDLNTQVRSEHKIHSVRVGLNSRSRRHGREKGFDEWRFRDDLLRLREKF